MVYVHQTVLEYTVNFLLTLRRKNYVTPKHYLDFINTYLRLLEEKNEFILAQVSKKVFVKFETLIFPEQSIIETLLITNEHKLSRSIDLIKDSQIIN